MQCSIERRHTVAGNNGTEAVVKGLTGALFDTNLSHRSSHYQRTNLLPMELISEAGAVKSTITVFVYYLFTRSRL